MALAAGAVDAELVDTVGALEILLDTSADVVLCAELTGVALAVGAAVAELDGSTVELAIGSSLDGVVAP